MTYEELVEIARADDAIVGLVLTGSRARGVAVTEDSDWDVRLVVRDDLSDEHRARFPFNRFLRWELGRRPFAEPVFAADMLLARLDAIRSGDLAEQRRTLRDVEALARAHGHGDVIDGWEPDVVWLRGG